MNCNTPTFRAKNITDQIELSGAALCALADIIKAADPEKIDMECTWGGLGYLLNILGGVTLEQSDHLRQELRAAEGAPAPK